MLVAVLTFVFGCRKPVEVSFVNDTMEIGAQGGTLEVSLQSNGDWTINAMPNWITVSPNSGTGNATLTLSVLPNTISEVRVGKIEVASKNNSAIVTVTQAANDESGYLRVSPEYYSCDQWGDTLEINVESNLEWRLTGLPNWMTASMTEGIGDGFISILIDPIQEEISEGREAILTFVGDGVEAKITIRQLNHSEHVFSVDPMELAFSCLSGIGTITVTSTIPWTVSTEVDWITFSPSSGNGNAEVMVNVAENTALTIREANIQFEYAFSGGSMGKTFVWVRQEGAPDQHFLEVSPLSFLFGREGGIQEINIECDTEWKVDLQSDWLTVSETLGTGNATIQLIAAPNDIVEPRQAEFAISSDVLIKTLKVAQEAGVEPIVAMLTPDTIFASYMGGVYHLELISNVDWQLESSDWISLMTASSGEGNASIDIVIDFNSSELGRVGYVRVLRHGQVLFSTIAEQEGKPNIFETDLTEIDVRPEGGDYVIHVTANQSWSVIPDSEWMSCLPESGFGNGDITITVAPLPSVRPRIGHLKLKGSSGIEIIITINQHQ